MKTATVTTQAEPWKPSEQQVQNLLTRLGEKWMGLHRINLSIRHETGMSLNELLGDPDERQPYGAEVVKRVCEAIGTDTTEVSRMRQFAKKYPTLDDFRERHPEATAWKNVKPLLVKNPKGTGKSKSEEAPVNATTDSSD